MTNKQIKVVAHRGLSSKYPENTLIAYEAALQLNIDYLEIDIHKTVDNKLVLIHDDTVDRTSNGTGKIKDYTMEQLQQFDYGLWKGEAFEGQTILEFKDVLNLAIQYNKKLLIEIKKPEQYPDIEHLLLKQLRESQVQPSNIAIQSFNKQSIKKISETGVEYKLGVLISAKTHWYRWPNFKKIATFAHFLNPNYKLITKKFVATAHKYNLELMPYTVNDKVINSKLIKSNIDGIITDTPDIFCD